MISSSENKEKYWKSEVYINYDHYTGADNTEFMIWNKNEWWNKRNLDHYEQVCLRQFW